MNSSHSNNIFSDSESEGYSDDDNNRQRSVQSDQQQVTTDDENHLLSPQSSPSPFGSSGEELSSNEQNQEEENYLDPDLYCLRRSNRQKDKSSLTVSFFSCLKLHILENN